MAHMVYSFDIALKKADWLDPKGADKASIELARRYCHQLDIADDYAAVDPGDPDRVEHTRKVYTSVGRNLQLVLASLGMSPEARGELAGKKEEEKAVNPFDELKKKRQQKKAAG